MQKPPFKKTTQSSFIQSAVRFPPELHEELIEAAKRNGRSLNAEVIARLSAKPIQDRLDSLDVKSSEIKRLLKQLIDK